MPDARVGCTACRRARQQADLRAATGWGDTQLKCHLARLVELEYLAVHRVLPQRGRAGGFAYELLWDGAGRDGAAHLSGLVEPDALRAYDGTWAGSAGAWSGSDDTWSGSGRPVVAPWAGHGRSAGNGILPWPDNGLPRPFAALPGHASSGGGGADDVVPSPQAAQA